MFSYILSCKIRPREFIDWNISSPVTKNVKLRKKARKDWSSSSSHSNSVYCHIEGLRRASQGLGSWEWDACAYLLVPQKKLDFLPCFPEISQEVPWNSLSSSSPVPRKSFACSLDPPKYSLMVMMKPLFKCHNIVVHQSTNCCPHWFLSYFSFWCSLIS